MNQQWDDPKLCGAISPDKKLSCSRPDEHDDNDQFHSAILNASDGSSVRKRWWMRKWLQDDQEKTLCGADDHGDTKDFKGLGCSKAVGHEGAHEVTIAGTAWSLDWVSGSDGLTTIVDGVDAKIVLDGTGGAKEPDQLRLIAGDPDAILKALRAKHEALMAQESELLTRKAAHDEQKKIVERVQGEHNALVAELCFATKDGESIG